MISQYVNCYSRVAFSLGMLDSFIRDSFYGKAKHFDPNNTER